MAGGERIAMEELQRIAAQGLTRALEPLRTPAGPVIEIGHERLINFSSNDYLGLAADPRLAAALAEGARRWGTGAGASRLVCGDFEPHEELERAIARFEGAEAALLFNSGYAANCGLVPALVGPDDVVFSDALNHASLIDGCRLSRAQVRVYPHADATTLARLLASTPARRKLVLTDTIFSMDGDVAPLRELVVLCERFGALLAVDEAHASGVLGPRGAGLVAELGLEAKVDARMGTLSKAAGLVGAHVAGSRALIELLVNRARPLVFSTALPPALAMAARTALELLAGPEGDERRGKLWRNVRRLAAALRGLGLPARDTSPIFPVVLGEPQRALEVAAALRRNGVLVKAIRPPTVPAGTSRLRIALSAAHDDAHVDALAAALRSTL